MIPKGYDAFFSRILKVGWSFFLLKIMLIFLGSLEACAAARLKWDDEANMNNRTKCLQEYTRVI